MRLAIIRLGLGASLALGAFGLPAMAAPAFTNLPTASSVDGGVASYARYRGHGYGRGYGRRGHFRDRRRGYGHGYGRRGYGYRHHRRGGVGAGALIGGLAAGAWIGGAIASQSAPSNAQAASCAQRFKSYEPRSGTYLGYDGNRHACP